jgi:hypothetical protein
MSIVERLEDEIGDLHRQIGPLFRSGRRFEAWLRCGNHGSCRLWFRLSEGASRDRSGCFAGTEYEPRRGPVAPVDRRPNVREYARG